MHTGFVNIIFYGLFILFSSVNTAVSYEINKAEYYNYLFEVTEHFSRQLGWGSNYFIVENNRAEHLSIKEFFEEDLSKNKSVLVLFNKIAQMTNCRYTEIVKKFFFILTQVTNYCNDMYYRNSSDNFIMCILSLRDILDYSRSLFVQFYAALTYLSLIDVKFISPKYENYSDYIVDELYEVQSYLSSMELNGYSCFFDDRDNFDIKRAHDFLQSVENLQLKIMSKLLGIPPENSIIMSILQNNTEYPLYKEIYIDSFTIDYPDFASYLYQEISFFLNQAMINDVQFLGFGDLLYPTSTKLIPPHDNSDDQDHRIGVLNFLFQQSCLKNINHISILYHDHTIKANRVVRDKVNHYNYYLKKEHMILLLRCRFFEILKNFDTILSAMLVKCNGLSSEQNNQSYYNCIAEFSNKIHLSKPMLLNLFNAIKILQKLSLWEERNDSNIILSTIRNIIRRFLNLLKENVSLNIRYDLDADTSKNLADNYQQIFNQLREPFQSKIDSEIDNVTNNLCIFKIPFLTSDNVEDFFNMNSDTYNVSPSDEHLQTSKQFSQFVKYCENVKNDHHPFVLIGDLNFHYEMN